MRDLWYQTLVIGSLADRVLCKELQGPIRRLTTQ